MRRALAVAAAALLGCGLPPPELDVTEHVRGEHHRLLHEPVEQLWPAVLAALDAEGLRVARTDRARGAISTAAHRYAERDVAKRLAEVGDLGAARGAGLRQVSEFRVAYHVLLTPAGGSDTSLRVRSHIEADDRSESAFLGGVLEVIPRRIEVPSRGVLERELMHRLAAELFTTEEMLFQLGEPGVD